MPLFRKRLGRTLAVGAAAVVTSAMLAPSAMAADPTGNFADFKYCPRANTAVESCFYSKVSSGSFTLGNATVPINKNIILQGGLDVDPSTGVFSFVNAVGAPTLSKTALTVPGGLTGLFDPQPGWNGLLVELLEAAINAANGVTATAELVGTPKLDLTAFATGQGEALTLPTRIKLDNPFLGSNCYIGSASSPVTLKLTTGTTAPPAPNSPITGNPGSLSLPPNGDPILVLEGHTLVDNSFSVPKASGCGPLLFRPLINAAVNLKEGFPSAAGRNTAILAGNSKLADVPAVNANAGS